MIPWDILRGVGGFIRGRAKAAEAKRERADRLIAAREEREIEQAKDRESNAHSMDVIMTKRAQGKRNIVFYGALIPIAMVFHPKTRPLVLEGFETLRLLPDWYLIGMGLMFVSIWGFRAMLMMVLQSRLCKMVEKGISLT